MKETLEVTLKEVFSHSKLPSQSKKKKKEKENPEKCGSCLLFRYRSKNLLYVCILLIVAGVITYDCEKNFNGTYHLMMISDQVILNWQVAISMDIWKDGNEYTSTSDNTCIIYC